ncbi:excinuclease ABC subunit UvrA [Methylacidimicrobium tartarophylax]|uniref:UvrABC system protein A n=1 Tax=Methylacidimicrobium tartarophylax TaxID=1041768 RepID=A0A5E6MC63_9BACT|nr:excinuclease ABC subunit UvrA [Methylacidimicrobium tartarophylax]VVM05915.1 UvrABC system protein A [Methylacidimicrobium tartarophylax]
MAGKWIQIRGAREHNLQNVDVDLPRNRLIVITGVSGSGKSSLAFDTLYAEGQRRYVESLSTYARQVLGAWEKPEVDRIEGLSPAIAIEQRTSGSSPRSTVATATDIYEFLRLLFAHFGIPHHPQTGKPLRRYTVPEMIGEILALPPGTSIQLLAPVIRGGGRKEFRQAVERMRQRGFVRARVNGNLLELEEAESLSGKGPYTMDALVDRLRCESEAKSRLHDSLELTIKTGDGVVLLLYQTPEGEAGERLFSDRHFDPETGFRFPDYSPRHFSFNNPLGACPACHGLGTELAFDADAVVPDPSLPLAQMPIAPWRRLGKALQAVCHQELERLAQEFGEEMSRPWQECAERFREVVLHGSGIEGGPAPKRSKQKSPFEGVLPGLERMYQEARSSALRARLRPFLARSVCRSCGGARLRPEVLAVTIQADGWPPRNIREFTLFSVDEAERWLKAIPIPREKEPVAADIFRELGQRLEFLRRAGLGYLTLDRETRTLSGGEVQRIRLATQMGARLSGVVYVLDEPSVGLHPRDHRRLLGLLAELRDLGNTVVVVEHDEETILGADYLIEMGPGAGPLGGRVLGTGSPQEVLSLPRSITGACLREPAVPGGGSSRAPGAGWLRVVGARANNLRNITVSFPLGCLTAVSGVSGSGKSTLVNDVLSRALQRRLHGGRTEPGAHERIEGAEAVDRLVIVDQEPIGRSPRSNPLTFSGAFQELRLLFARLPAARVRGYGPDRFSFNVPGGRCERCQGQGVIEVEMSFLPAVYVPCQSCGGKRFNQETLEVTYRGKSIAEVLEMTVDEGREFFRPVPAIWDRLDTLARVGLGYLCLGQSATNLSGGEAQRVKLAAELGRQASGRTLYILDEPTTGLHLADIEKLMEVLILLRNAGNTIILIEHNLRVLQRVDYLIDLGPEGGEGGGQVVAQGTPAQVAKEPASWTGRFLREQRDAGSRAAEERAVRA